MPLFATGPRDYSTRQRRVTYDASHAEHASLSRYYLAGEIEMLDIADLQFGAAVAEIGA